MSALRHQIELAILGRTATRAADAVLAIVEPEIRAAQAQALREAADASDRRILGAPFSGASLGPWLRDRADEIEAQR